MSGRHASPRRGSYGEIIPGSAMVVATVVAFVASSLAACVVLHIVGGAR
jgi:hypothetical protein